MKEKGECTEWKDIRKFSNKPTDLERNEEGEIVTLGCRDSKGRVRFHFKTNE